MLRAIAIPAPRQNTPLLSSSSSRRGCNARAVPVLISGDYHSKTVPPSLLFEVRADTVSGGTRLEVERTPGRRRSRDRRDEAEMA